jgi:hypothetical protein
MKPAQPSRKNGAATSRPPVRVGSSVSSRSFPPPMRREPTPQRERLHSTGSGARRPRGVTVFAIRAVKQAQPSRKNGAATPRPPVHVGSCALLRVRSTAHAPSRRLQRVSVVCTLVSRGQAPRRRPRQTAVLSLILTPSFSVRDAKVLD